MRIARYGKTRYWVVYASDGVLICITVYRKGAAEVVRRLQQALVATQQRQDTNIPTQEVQAQR
jgi:hypothetical protein